jgi:hypothetical protein
MADNSDTPAPAPAKATARKTMAPAARRPGGADDETYDKTLQNLSDAELDRLEQAIRRARNDRVRKPQAPSFGVSEGERAELEQHGETSSPWTGQKITGDGSPRE